MKELEKKATVVTVLMGLGHIRAAYPLRDLTVDGLLVYGSRRTTPAKEYRIWRKIRKIYYWSSRIGKIPLIGQPLLDLLLFMQQIRPYYPRTDLSGPNLAVRYLHSLIKYRGLCQALVDKARRDQLPVVQTFYATAVALDEKAPEFTNNYLLICDSDFNRVWVAYQPQKSHIKYLAPCTQVKRRLLAYGVAEERIYLTGFPLPKENIGSETGLEILKQDLFARLLRLDPARKFFGYHQQSVLYWLGQQSVPETAAQGFTVTFAIGGAGAQCELADKILQSLKHKIRAGEITLFFSAGIQKRVYEALLGYINRHGLYDCLEHGIHIVFDPDPLKYIEKFNLCMRTTDVLWTKPSELSFYCGLGIPILLAPPIGTHEQLNKRWLQEIHAGVKPSGPTANCHEWLFDLRENGRLAEAAWDGFLKARKLGTYKIERLIQAGSYQDGKTPLEQ